MSVTIDLGEVTSDVTNFFIQFNNIDTSGIAKPKDDVKIYVSEDGINFTLIAMPQFKYEGFSAYIHHIIQPIRTRYVKYSFVNDTTNFVFCGEAMVGKNGQLGSNAPTLLPSEPSENNTYNVLYNLSYSISGCGTKSSYYANLTDGLAANNLTDTAASDWCALYYQENAHASEINAPDGIGAITFDLKSIRTLNQIRIHTIHDESWAIGALSDIKIYISEDGINWSESSADIQIPTCGDGVAYWIDITGIWETRYIKIDCTLSRVFAFINEIEAYAEYDYGNTTVALGDVNFDGSIDSADYILVKRHCFGSFFLDESQKISADIDLNGSIDSSDYILLKRITFSTYSV